MREDVLASLGMIEDWTTVEGIKYLGVEKEVL